MITPQFHTAHHINFTKAQFNYLLESTSRILPIAIDQRIARDERTIEILALGKFLRDWKEAVAAVVQVLYFISFRSPSRN